MPRRSRFTPELAALIVDAVRQGLTYRDASRLAGINEHTLQRWIARYAHFAQQLERAKAERTQRWLGLLAEAGQRDWRAIAQLLDRCAPDYRIVQKTEQTVTVEVRRAAERVAAELGVPVDVVLAETYRLAKDEDA